MNVTMMLRNMEITVSRPPCWREGSGRTREVEPFHCCFQVKPMRIYGFARRQRPPTPAKVGASTYYLVKIFRLLLQMKEITTRDFGWGDVPGTNPEVISPRFIS